MITNTIGSYRIPSQNTLHATHLQQLRKKMHKYEMDPESIVKDAERTRFRPQTNRRTDERTGGLARWNQYTLLLT